MRSVESVTYRTVFRRGQNVARFLQVGHGLSQHPPGGRPEESSLPPTLGLVGGQGGLADRLELRPAAVAELGAQTQQGELPAGSLRTLQSEEGVMFHGGLPEVFTGAVRG